MNANTLALDIVRDSTQITRDELEAAMDGKVLTAIIGSTVSTLIRRGHLVERDDGVLEIGDENTIEAAAREREQRKAAPPVEPVYKSHREDPSMRQYPEATDEEFRAMTVSARILHTLGKHGPQSPGDLAKRCAAQSVQGAYTTLLLLKGRGQIRKVGKLYELAHPSTTVPRLEVEPTAPIVDVQAACAEAEELSRPEPAKVPPVYVPVAPKAERVRTIGDVAEKHAPASERTEKPHRAFAELPGVRITVEADHRTAAALALAGAVRALTKGENPRA